MVSPDRSWAAAYEKHGPGTSRYSVGVDSCASRPWPGVKDRDGRARTYTAGVGDRAVGSKAPGDGHTRIGSNTKTFTSVVVLQLVGGGKLRLG
ncbi:serine hydrolase [Streptomyces roseoverticillatus]|nr:serine hydrolase [Streptomyces roseoverticillatus]